MFDSANTNIDAAFEAIGAINRFDDATEISEYLRSFLSRYGFTSFLISRIPPQHERVEPGILINGCSLDWFYQYTKVNHYKNDPVARHCLKTLNPFTWDELPSDLLASPAARLVMDGAAEFGLRQGFTVPIHGPFNSLAVVTMAGSRIELPSTSRHLVHLMSIYAYSAAERTMQKIETLKPRGLLSGRERDILKWLAEGLTLGKTQELLGLSEGAINEYMRRIRRKLGAKTTVQAMIEAFLRHEIQL